MVLRKLKNAVRSVRELTDFEPEIGIILGSGLSDFCDEIDIVAQVSYRNICDFPISTVSGHDGKFVFGYLSGKKVVAMRGRVHYYEGYDMSQVVMPIRLMGMLGTEKVILTNAAGGINKDFKPGDLMLITGHISSLVPSPLRGENIDELGVRFPDMTEVYSKKLHDVAKDAAEAIGISLQEGVYIQTPGPNYETPEEINMYRAWGADAVGMSTACEAIAARHMSMEICGISCVSNMAAGLNKVPLTHEEIKETADRVSNDFRALIKEIVGRITM